VVGLQDLGKDISQAAAGFSLENDEAPWADAVVVGCLDGSLQQTLDQRARDGIGADHLDGSAGEDRFESIHTLSTR
jgi:hypothetical protein